MAKKINLAQWYTITIVSGNEDSVVRNLKGKIEAYGLSDLIQDIKVIKDTVVTEEIFTEDDLPPSYGRKQQKVQWETFKDANGKMKYKKIRTSEVNRFFGYIFIKMIMTEEAWFAIRNTQLITGIVGSSGKNTKPIPIANDEIESILNYKTGSEIPEIVNEDVNISVLEDSIIIEKKKFVADFVVGQSVNIINGNMSGQKGIVKYIDYNKGIASILVDIFGRETNVEVNFQDVELDK